MAWLFERMIELAAWVAFILGVFFFVDAGYHMALWVRSMFVETPDARLLLEQSGRSAASFVASALAMGALACIDRYVFDLPEPNTK